MSDPRIDIDNLSINTIRTLCINGVQKANSGHPGMPPIAKIELLTKSNRPWKY